MLWNQIFFKDHRFLYRQDSKYIRAIKARNTSKKSHYKCLEIDEFWALAGNKKNTYWFSVCL